MINIKKIKLIEELLSYNFDPNDFCLINSVWMTLLSERQNNDLDLLVNSKLMSRIFNENITFVRGLPGKFENRIRIHPLKSVYSKYIESIPSDEIIKNHTVRINNVLFIIPRYYFQYKLDRLQNSKATIEKFSTFRKIVKTNFFSSAQQKKAFKKYDKDVSDLLILKEIIDRRGFPSELNLNDFEWGIDLFSNYNT